MHGLYLYHQNYTCFLSAGAVAFENVHPPLTNRLVNTELQCSGLESNITTCIQNLDKAYSCLPFGIASVTCHSKFIGYFSALYFETLPPSIFFSWNPQQNILHWWWTATSQWICPRRRQSGDLHQQCLGYCLWWWMGQCWCFSSLQAAGLLPSWYVG